MGAGRTGKARTRRASGAFRQAGAALVYLIGMIVVMGALGGGLVSMYSTSTLQSAYPNAATRARLMAESGLRYAISEIRNADPANLSALIAQLNADTHTASDGGTFQLNVFSLLSFAAANTGLVNPSGQLAMISPNGADVPSGYSIPVINDPQDGLYLVNTANNGLDNAPNALTVTRITSLGDIGGNQLASIVQGAIATTVNDPLFVAVKPTTNQNVVQGGSLEVSRGASIYPTKNGRILIPTTGGRRTYTYATMTATANGYLLTNLQKPVGTWIAAIDNLSNVGNSDYVVFDSSSGGAYQIMSTGRWGAGALQASRDLNASDTGGLSMQSSGGQGYYVVENVSGVIVVDNTVQIHSGDVTDYSGGITFDPVLTSSPDVAGSFSGPIGVFGSGVRLFFTFNVAATSAADGFIFTLRNAGLNTVNDSGGPRVGSHGGYIGYAGPGLAAWGNGMGIRPPKFGLEFDLWNNGAYTVACGNDGRNDPNDKHIAWVYWGRNGTINAGNALSCPGYTEDDNVHNRGGANTPADPDPLNPASGTAGKFYSFANRNGASNTLSLVGGNHTVRIEVHRDTSPKSGGGHAGMYEYTLKAWYNCVTLPGCTDVTSDYNVSSSSGNLVYLADTIYLTATQHTQFDTFIYGFQTATGAATGDITLTFPKIGMR